MLPFFGQHDGHKEELTERIQKIYESGCRAFCLESRPFEDFCGESWWENVEIILREAKRLGMKVWILDDKHFPTGYLSQGQMESAKQLIAERIKILQSNQLN